MAITTIKQTLLVRKKGRTSLLRARQGKMKMKAHPFSRRFRLCHPEPAPVQRDQSVCKWQTQPKRGERGWVFGGVPRGVRKDLCPRGFRHKWSSITDPAKCVAVLFPAAHAQPAL